MFLKPFSLTLSLTLLPLSLACVNTFTQVQVSSSLLTGFILDNGIQVCTATNRARGLDNHFWFDCIRGFAAWTDDGRLVAYAHDGVDYRMRPQSCVEDAGLNGGKMILCAGAAYC